MDLRCTGQLEIERDDGSRGELELGGLSFRYLEAFEPSMVVIHKLAAATGSSVEILVDVVEDGSGYLFATVALRGGRVLAAGGLGAVCDGAVLELRASDLRRPSGG